MSSIFGRVASALSTLQMPSGKQGYPEWIFDTCERIDCQIKAFESGFRFLTLFQDCIDKWSDAKLLVPDLASKIEATVKEITSEAQGKEVKKFGKELTEIKEDRRSIFKRKSLQKRASKFLDVFTNFNAKINILKSEIREGCEELSGQTFQSHSSMCDFDDWKECLLRVCSCMKEVGEKYASDDRDISIDIAEVVDSLVNLQSYLDGLCDTYKSRDYIRKNPDIPIPIANVVNRAALMFCRCWASQYDPILNEDLMIAVLNLQRKSNFTDPEALDQMLRLLKNLRCTGSFKEKAEEFARNVLPFNRRFEKFTGRRFCNGNDLTPSVFQTEIESLTTNILKNLNISKKYDEFEQTFLLDFKLLISETEKSFSCSLPGDGTLLLNLLAKAWLIKTEVLIIQPLTANFPLVVHKQFDALNQGVQQIKELQGEHSDNVNQILLLMEEVAKLVPSLYHSLSAKEITRDMVRTVLLLLLLKILHFNIERKFCDNRTSMLIVEDRLQSFLEGLKFLINCFISQQCKIVKDGVLEVSRIERMARRVISLYHSLLTHNIAEDMMENVSIVLSDLLDEMKIIMSKIWEIDPHVSKSNFPKTNALGFFDSLLRKLRELLNYKADLFASIKQNIEEVSEHLELFRQFLGDIVKHEMEIQELRDLAGHVIDIAYEAAYLVDSIVGGLRSECHNLIWFYYFLQDIRHITMQVANVHDKKTIDVQVQNVPQTSKHLVSKTTNPGIDGDVLSLNDQQEVIIDRLVHGCRQRDTVSIVGMPGVGKTTLAKKVYSSPKVAHHFHIRAWCCVTEIYRKRQLLLEILSHVTVLTDNILGMSNEDLDFRLRQLLLKKRYLIVMDDMWNSEAWDDLQRSFPDDENGSRILITSRHNDVALKAKVHSDPHHLRLLSNTESWQLLQMKIFRKECCPLELIEVAMEIAKNCKGLPLAIVAMAGILERTDKLKSQWKQIAENLSSRIVADPEEQCRDILELSYNHLPDYLQACFLYFGAFLEDQEIPARKLIQLWIAEGFIQKTDLISQEDLAAHYLNDLIGRSLVIFAQPRSRGGTKTCRVHDMLRILCQSKAKEDNFLQVITRCNESDASDDLDFTVDVDFSNSSNCCTYEDYRLCFYSKRYQFVESRPSGPYAHSLLFFATSDKYARSSYDISFICHNFRLLKVLDLECINMGPAFPNGIELMFQLTYLAVSGDVDSVPSLIANLQNLETFVLKGLKGKVNLPDTIWCLKRLRHVHVKDVAVIDLQDNKLGNSTPPENLVALSCVFLHYGEEANNILTRFRNLRKLGCMLSVSADCSGIYNLLPRFGVLTKLESLKMSYHGRALANAEFSLPSSLKKLTLSNFRLPWSHISVIGKLQNLEVLKLFCRAYDGETWDMVDGEFLHLKFLKLDSLNIAKWNASSDCLPKLEQLVLRNCKYLEEVPSSFVDICTLQMIEVQWCGKYAEESARRMQEEADEYLKVIITSDLESRSSS